LSKHEQRILDMTNRTGTGIAGHRRRNSIVGSFTALPTEMLESLAWRVLSLSARRVLDRVAIELRHHGGFQGNGLCVTFADFQKYGIERHAIAPAIREAVALGFLSITRQGRGGNAEFRRAQWYKPTYLNTRDGEPTHQWRRFTTIAETKQTAAKARGNKNRNPVRVSPPTSVRVSPTENHRPSVRVSPPLGPGENHTTSDISRGGRSGGRLVAASTSTSTSAVAPGNPRPTGGIKRLRVNRT
jgi:hypothetical protein